MCFTWSLVRPKEVPITWQVLESHVHQPLVGGVLVSRVARARERKEKGKEKITNGGRTVRESLCASGGDGRWEGNVTGRAGTPDIPPDVS